MDAVTFAFFLLNDINRTITFYGNLVDSFLYFIPNFKKKLIELKRSHVRASKFTAFLSMHTPDSC